MRLEISTIIKLAKIAVDKYGVTSTQPGFITTQNGQKIKVTFSELSKALDELSSQDLVSVRRCKDCDNWSKAPRAKLGACFPKDHSCTRGYNDFCSNKYVYRTKESRDVDEAVAKLLSKERA